MRSHAIVCMQTHDWKGREWTGQCACVQPLVYFLCLAYSLASRCELPPRSRRRRRGKLLPWTSQAWPISASARTQRGRRSQQGRWKDKKPAGWLELSTRSPVYPSIDQSIAQLASRPASRQQFTTSSPRACSLDVCHYKLKWRPEACCCVQLTSARNSWRQ